MKQINVKLLVTLFVCGIVFAVGVHFLHEFQARRRAATLLTLAEAKKAEGDFATATRLLQNYLRRRPDDLEKYGQLALTMKEMLANNRKQGKIADPTQYQKAYAWIEEALRKTPDNFQLREAAIEFSQLYRRYADAINHLDYMINASGKDAKSEWYRQLATCHMLSGQDVEAVDVLAKLNGFDPAKRTFDSSAAAHPDDVDSYFLLARLYRQNRNDQETADAIVDQMVTANPESHLAYLRRAAYNRTVHPDDKDGIYFDLDKALALSPEDPAVLLESGQSALQRQDYDKAKELFERCLKLHPDNISAYYGLSTWARYQKQFDAAIEYLDAGLAKDPRNTALVWHRANVLLELRQFDEMDQMIKDLNDLNFAPARIEFLKGRVHFQKMEWLDARRKYEAARPVIAQINPEWLDTLDNDLARCYQQLGLIDLALQAYSNMIDRNPANLGARWGKVVALYALNRIDDALADYELVHKQLTNLEGQSPQVLRQHLTLEMNKQVRATEKERDWRKTEEILRVIMSNDQISRGAKTKMLAEYFANSGQEQRAEALLQQQREKNPNDLAVLLESIRQKSREEGGGPAALAELDELTAKAGDNVSFRMVRAEVLALTRPEGYAEALASLAENVDDFSERQRVILLRDLTTRLNNLGEYDRAEKIAEQLVVLRSEDIGVQVDLFRNSLRSNDDAKISNWLKRLEVLAGTESAVSKWARAAYIVNRVHRQEAPATQLDEAMSLADEAKRMREDWEPIYRLYGQVALLQNKRQEALVALEKARALGSGNVELLRQLVRLYVEAGRIDEAADLLDKIPPIFWGEFEKRVNLQLLAQRGELPEDLPYDANSTNPMDHLFVARLLLGVQRYEEAETAVQRAIALDDDSVEAWGTYFQMLVKQEKLAEAQTILADAQEKLPPDVRSGFLGGAYMEMNDWEKSQRYFVEALREKPGNPAIMQSLASVYLEAGNLEAGRETLSQLIELDSDVAANQVAWARRKLAAITASSSTYGSFREAQTLIEQNAGDGGLMVPDDLLLWSRLALQRTDAMTHRKAIKVMERHQDSRKLVDDELFVLAQLYENVGRWPDCKSVMLSILTRHANDVRILTPWLRWLLERDELKQAITWVKNAPPESLASIRTLAQIDVRRGQSERALKRVATLLPNRKEVATQQLPALRTVAVLVEQMGEYDPKLMVPAEKLWRRLVQLEPSRMLELAAFLRRREDPAKYREAFELCGKAFENGQIEESLQMSLLLLRNYNGPASDRRTYESAARRWFDRAIRQRPDSGVVLIQRSEFEDIFGNQKASEDLLRRFLEGENRRPQQRAVVSNNLAYKLALNGEGEESKELIDEAIRVFGPRADLRDTLGMVYLAQKQYGLAVKEFEAAIENGGPSAAKFMHLAIAHWRAGNAAAAAEAARSVFDFDDSQEGATDVEKELFDELLRDLKDQGIRIETNDNSESGTPSSADKDAA